jgi:hypothetical protein
VADLDTRAKRLAGINPGTPWRGLLPDPTGTVGIAQREQLVFLYNGISPNAATVVDATGVAGTGAVGSVTAIGAAIVLPTGVTATGYVGQVTVIGTGVAVDVQVTGVYAVGYVGTVAATIPWTAVDASNTTTWSPVNDAQTSIWTEITT